MLKFHCYSCKEEFRIKFENLYNKVAIVCPNCNLTVPEEATVAFRQMSESFMDAVDVLYKSNEYNNGWGISVIDTTEAMPRPVSEFAQFAMNEEEKITFWDHRKPIFDELEWKKKHGLDID